MDNEYEKIIKKKSRRERQAKPRSFSKSSGSRGRQASRKSGALPLKTKVKVRFD